MVNKPMTINTTSDNGIVFLSPNDDPGYAPF